jgi:hypothetical protein
MRILKLLMIGFIIAFSIICLEGCGSGGGGKTASWKLVGPANFTAGTADKISLSVYNGTPYVAYKNATDTKAYVRQFSGGAWSLAGGGAVSSAQADYISLFVFNNKPYVAYCDYDVLALHKLTVMKLNDARTGWDAVGGSAGISSSAVRQTSIYVFDGKPYVAYEDNSTRRLSVMKYDGGWGLVGGAGFSDPNRDFSPISLFVYNNGGTAEPYVAYTYAVGPSDPMPGVIMKYDSGWSKVGGANFDDDIIGYPSLFVYNGKPYVAYGKNSTAGTVKMFDTSWSEPGGAGTKFTSGYATFNSLFIYNGTPYVVYKTASVADEGDVVVKKFNGSTWVAVGTSLGRTRGCVSLFVYNGVPYVAFQDETNSRGVTVKKYQ